MIASALSPEQRSAALAGMRRQPEFDVLIIGGGVVGAGAALDAVTRGLSTAIVEARDWASGTSSRSSKLIHGGLRYLEMLDFGLVREALHERGLLVQRIAPHLVRPVPFLYPLTGRVWERPYVGAGMLLYDTLGTALGTGRGLPHHRHLSRRRALREAPCLRPDALTGAVQYWDAQVDDARHTLAVVRTAVSFGALAANRTRVIGLLRVGERVTGARVIDLETGAEFEVRAKQVINATGVWTDQTQQLADTRGQFHVRASKGVHLVVPRDRLQSSTGIILRTETSVLFVIPWGRHWIIGTTDTDWNLDLAHPAASARDIDYLLERVNSVLISPLTRADVEGVYAGLRPLLSGESESTSKLSREHVVGHPVPGLVVIAGGKYTTYRVMGRDAVDEAVRGLDARVPASCTDTVPLVGAEGWPAVRNQRHRLAAESGLHVARIEHLLGRYGSLIHDLLAMIAADPELAEPLPGIEDYLLAEVVYAVSHEGARHLDDVLARRTRASIEAWDRGVSAAPVV
ncbi:MAG TPA: glycerol-3-phosphate dehydrogenase/oxidase, partial [Jatrophihabitans sp.]|nr:glycerol-3-phosphate dehydrogenase/oxidase [Jatrophihabitans sp.]